MSHDHRATGDFGRAVRGIMFKLLPFVMTCREFEGFILDYLDDRLSTKARWLFRLHLLFCRDCRAYLAAYRRSVRLNQAVFSDPGAPLPEEVPGGLVKAVLAARSVDADDPDVD